MHGCDRDVRSVGGSFARDFAGDQNAGRSLSNLSGDVQQWKIPNYFHPFTSCGKPEKPPVRRFAIRHEEKAPWFAVK